MMVIRILLEAIAVFVLVLTLPLQIELLVLSLASLLRIRRVSLASSSSIRLAVIIPAHDEEELIARTVKSLLAAEATGCEVFVVAHNCSDKTAELARTAGANVLELNDPALCGKGNALNHGFNYAIEHGFDAVMVIDADSVVSSDLIDTVQRAFATGVEALQCRYQVLNIEENRFTRLFALAFLGMNVVRPRGRMQLGLSAGIFGNGFALRTSLLQRIPYNAHSVVEDLEYHLLLIRAGVRVEFVNEAVVYGDMPKSDKGARSQRARWEGGRRRMRKEWTWRLAGEVMKGHLRMLEPLLDLRSLPIANQLLLIVLTFILPMTWIRIYASISFIILLMHVSIAAISGYGFLGTLRVLALVPSYILWKIRIMAHVRRTSRADSNWVRTSRE